MTKLGTLFTGFGGVEVGALAAGLELAWGVEYRADVAAVANRNLGDHVIVADVRDVDYATLPHVDVLHASPVCTRASQANTGAVETDEDITIADAVIRALDAQQPDVFTLENVWMYRTFKAFENICKALGRNGYIYDFEHVNSADFGVPQTRKRLILRAVRGLLPPLPLSVAWVGWYAAIEDLIPTLPESKLAPWQLARLPEDLQSLVFGNNPHTASNAPAFVVADTPMMSVTSQYVGRSRAVLVAGDSNANSWGDNYRQIDDPSFTAKQNTVGRSKAVLVDMHNAIRDATVMASDAPTSTVGASDASRPSHRLAILIDGDSGSVADGTPTLRSATEPAMTIRSKRIPPHRAQLQTGRVVSMTPRALARFQSFPDWYELPEKRGLAAYGIGNAVPPLLYQRIIEGLTHE